MNNEMIFDNIYEKGLWGRKNGASTSGSGSHKGVIIGPYIDEVKSILQELGKPSVIDLGCGDFNVGKNFVDVVSHYLACDVSEVILKRNRVTFEYEHVLFKKLDLSLDELLVADIAFVRQVLQHLNNEQIQAFVDQLHQVQLLVTEHQPLNSDFTPNVDIETGSGFRLPKKSGVQLDKPPFNLNYIDKKTILEVPEYGGMIRSFLCTLK